MCHGKLTLWYHAITARTHNVLPQSAQSVLALLHHVMMGSLRSLILSLHAHNNVMSYLDRHKVGVNMQPGVVAEVVDEQL